MDELLDLPADSIHLDVHLKDEKTHFNIQFIRISNLSRRSSVTPFMSH